MDRGRDDVESQFGRVREVLVGEVLVGEIILRQERGGPVELKLLVLRGLEEQSLLPVAGNSAGVLDRQSHAVVLNVEHGDDYIVANHQALVDTAQNDFHLVAPVTIVLDIGCINRSWGDILPRCLSLGKVILRNSSCAIFPHG